MYLYQQKKRISSRIIGRLRPFLIVIRGALWKFWDAQDTIMISISWYRSSVRSHVRTSTRVWVWFQQASKIIWVRFSHGTLIFPRRWSIQNRYGGKKSHVSKLTLSRPRVNQRVSNSVEELIFREAVWLHLITVCNRIYGVPAIGHWPWIAEFRCSNKSSQL